MYTLQELNTHIRQVLLLNFPDAFWVQAEIADCGVSRGHTYLQLVQKDAAGDEVLATMDAVLWQREAQQWRRQNGEGLGLLLQRGNAVLLKAELDHHPRYGLKLNIKDIDLSYTEGQLERRRRQTLERLRASGEAERNGRLALPPIVQRVAVISSARAAGWQDFRQQLAGNPYGYRFALSLFEAAMQGEQVASELPAQLAAIAARQAEFDAVVIVRGGGAKLDLAAFDAYEVAAAIAACPLPVLTGIGHETDQSVADVVAHTALKTPTAVAEHLVQRHAHFEAQMAELRQRFRQQAARLWQQEGQRLAQARQAFGHARAFYAERQRFRLLQSHKNAYFAARQRLAQARQALQSSHERLRGLDPRHLAAQGYARLWHAGRPLNDPADLPPGTELEALLGEWRLHLRLSDKQKRP